MRLTDEIISFLESNSFQCSRQMRNGFEVICLITPQERHPRIILPLEIKAFTHEDAVSFSESAAECILFIRHLEEYPIIITEDRWNTQREMMQTRLLAHLEVFTPVFARNCEVRRIEKEDAQGFLNINHSYGYASCRYHYGMFSKKTDELIAVATFSNARRWKKAEKEIRSYEWTRYASLPSMRISGGMGKLLKAFISDIAPDDIMSYADLEWSEGDVYARLGFRWEARKDPVMFCVDPDTWIREPVRNGANVFPVESKEKIMFFRNFGSNKYRLKLTDYE